MIFFNLLCAIFPAKIQASKNYLEKPPQSEMQIHTEIQNPLIIPHPYNYHSTEKLPPIGVLIEPMNSSIKLPKEELDIINDSKFLCAFPEYCKPVLQNQIVPQQSSVAIKFQEKWNKAVLRYESIMLNKEINWLTKFVRRDNTLKLGLNRFRRTYKNIVLQQESILSKIEKLYNFKKYNRALSFDYNIGLYILFKLAHDEIRDTSMMQHVDFSVNKGMPYFQLRLYFLKDSISNIKRIDFELLNNKNLQLISKNFENICNKESLLEEYTEWSVKCRILCKSLLSNIDEQLKNIEYGLNCIKSCELFPQETLLEILNQD